jgi:hypothetical protein
MHWGMLSGRLFSVKEDVRKGVTLKFRPSDGLVRLGI